VIEQEEEMNEQSERKYTSMAWLAALQRAAACRDLLIPHLFSKSSGFSTAC